MPFVHVLVSNLCMCNLISFLSPTMLIKSVSYYIQGLVLLLSSISCYGDNTVFKSIFIFLTCRINHCTLKTIGCHIISHKCPCILTTNTQSDYIYIFKYVFSEYHILHTLISLLHTTQIVIGHTYIDIS